MEIAPTYAELRKQREERIAEIQARIDAEPDYDPQCTCIQTDVDFFDCSGCDLCDSGSDFNRQRRAALYQFELHAKDDVIYLLSACAELARELAELRADKERLDKATRFHISDSISIERCEGHRLPKQPYMWAVRQSGFCLAKDGDWECEPIPSSRDEEFYQRCRFETYMEAELAARKATR